MFEDVSDVQNHWWWRPGWREGRHIYACHLILNDQPQLRALVARYQEALKPLSMLDLIPPQWLHITTQGIGFVDEVSPDEAEAIRQGIADRLKQIDPPIVTFQHPTIRPEAVLIKAHPAEPLYSIRQQIHHAVADVVGSDRAEPLPRPEDYAPHVSIAYVNADAPAEPIATAIKGVEVEPVTVTFTKADFLEFHRDHRMYEWMSDTPVPFMTR